MNGDIRPFSGLLVNLSISETEDTEDRGFPKWQVNRTALQIVSALFSQGAGVAFGHDWRPDGVMEAVHGFAVQMQEAGATPLLWNVLPWTDETRLSADEQERLKDTLRIVTVRSPGRTDDEESRVLALTQMREQLTAMCHARICLGGRTSGYQGTMPGVYEEALFSVRAGKPLYLVGMFGGATRLAIDAIEGRRIDPRIPYSDYLSKDGWKILKRNGLSLDENRLLFDTPVLEDAIVFILSGLARSRRDNWHG